jgi:hypothetical protein
MEQFAAVMDEPFPALTDLRLSPFESDFPAEFPDSFLGGSAPLLRSFFLEDCVFSALPNLVLSATHFHQLHLLDIPRAGYIPPEAMVTFLIPLHNLKGLTIGFSSPESRPFQTSPPPSARALLPSLTDFQFNGVSEYLVDFIARIDTPMLDNFRMTFYWDTISNISQLPKFIDRIDKPKTFTHAKVLICHGEVQAIFKSLANLGLDITYVASVASDLPIVSMVRLFDQLLTIASQVEQLVLYGIEIEEEEWQYVVGDAPWLQLVNPFVSVKSLYVCENMGPFVASALKGLTGERVTEVLPRLDDLFLEGLGSSGFVAETIGSFVSIRQFSGHPVILRRWERVPA